MRDKRANYGVCKANFVLVQNETKNVSHMFPKSGKFVKRGLFRGLIVKWGRFEIKLQKWVVSSDRRTTLR